MLFTILLLNAQFTHLNCLPPSSIIKQDLFFIDLTAVLTITSGILLNSALIFLFRVGMVIGGGEYTFSFRYPLRKKSAGFMS